MMKMRIEIKPSFMLLCAFSAVFVLGVAGNAVAGKVASIGFLGEAGFATGTQYSGTEVGGLSGIVYNASTKTYTALSDARGGGQGAPRWYDMQINLSDGSLDAGDVTITGVTSFSDIGGGAFAANDIDPEGIAQAPGGGYYISSERDLLGAPWIRKYSLTGEYLDSLQVASKYFNDSSMTKGVRNNLAFESLNVTPDQTRLFAATENALIQDGTASTTTTPSPARIVSYDLTGGTPEVIAEFVYMADLVSDEPIPEDSFHTNGLVDLLAIDNDTLLAMERSFSVGVGNRIKIYEISLDGATDVSGLDELLGSEDPVAKKLIADLGDEFGISPDNVEGMVFGGTLENGHQSLIMVSDNNFNPGQFTQFLAFEVQPVPVPKSFSLMMIGSMALLWMRRRQSL